MRPCVRCKRRLPQMTSSRVTRWPWSAASPRRLSTSFRTSQRDARLPGSCGAWRLPGGIVGIVSRPSTRLSRRVQRDFPASRVDDVLSVLSTIPESLPLADKQSAERLQAAALLLANGDLEQLHKAIHLARQDWRDLLVAAGLENGDWPAQPTSRLGPA